LRLKSLVPSRDGLPNHRPLQLAFAGRAIAVAAQAMFYRRCLLSYRSYAGRYSVSPDVSAPYGRRTRQAVTYWPVSPPDRRLSDIPTFAREFGHST